jgi:monomeric phenylalanine-4-hydroxylase
MNPKKQDITLLDLDHPGATDVRYRKRREAITKKADQFLQNPTKFPRVRYTKKENETWTVVLATLDPLHKLYASRVYLEGKRRLGLPTDCVPQLEELSRRLRKLNNVTVEPIGGLVDTRWFLEKLRNRTMTSTQYIRHHSRPDYTPEPDIIHECVGHLPMFTNKAFVSFSQRLGEAAGRASGEQLQQIERLYWFTMEFGLIRENGQLKAYGAGLLSSFGELPHAFSNSVDRKEFSIKEVIRTPYDYSGMQQVLFVIPSLKSLREETNKFLKSEGL